MPTPETFRAIAEEASDGMFVTDETFRIEWVNPAGCALLGHPLDALVGKRVSDLFWDANELARVPLPREDLLAGRATITTRSFRTADGKPRVLEVSAKRLTDGRLLGIARDATERREAEERLRRSEASFRALIERSPIGVVVHRAGKLVYANETVVQLLGWRDVSDYIGSSVIDLVHPDARAHTAERIRLLQAGQPSVPFIEEKIRRADGTYFLASVGGMTAVFEGEPSIVVLARDVTMQRQLEEQLARADRLSSLGTLAAGVAHEINNPLTYVCLHLEAIAAAASKVSGGRAIVEHTSSALEGAHRVARIVRDLRALSHSGDDARTTVDVKKPIELALNTAHHELKHRARVVRDLARVPSVQANEGRLAQIVLNLLLNAAQSIPEGRPDENEVRIHTRAVGDEVHIAVSDTGVGINDEHRRRLFEPFFTTKSVGEGSGLGLAICHSLVTALGGRIDVESAEGRGSTFTIVLPAASPAAASEVPPALPTTRAGSSRILVVDDEPAICAALARALSTNHDVVVANSARAACDLIERDSAFDVVVCDVVMPEMSGIDLHQWMSERHPGLAARTVFVSGGRVSSGSEALRSAKRGAWLDKPFTLDALERVIADVCASNTRG